MNKPTNVASIFLTVFLALQTKLFPLHNHSFARHWWLTPIILTTQEAEIRRILVQSQPGQRVPETLSRKTFHKKGLVGWLKV
jgi:hypothetical protein